MSILKRAYFITFIVFGLWPSFSFAQWGQLIYEFQCTVCHGSQGELELFGEPLKEVVPQTSSAELITYIDEAMPLADPSNCGRWCAGQVTRYMKEAFVAPPEPDNDSLLSSSGTFTRGQENFSYLLFPDDTAGNVDFSQRNANFTVANPTFFWAVQLMHRDVELQFGQLYTLCFDARASGQNTLSVDFDADEPTFESIIGGALDVTLSTTFESYALTVAALNTGNSRLVFHLGADASDYEFDNIAVYPGTFCRNQ